MTQTPSDMTASPRLDLPLLQSGQAQKHVTVNTALMRLDALVQASVRGTDTVPPAGAQDGDLTIIGSASAWADICPGCAQGDLAAYDGTAWRAHTPAEGWRVWSRAEDTLLVFRDGAWDALTTGEGGGGESGGGDSGEGGGSWPESVERFGINATPDAANRLAVKSEAVLLSHEDGARDVRLTLNRADAGAVSSVVFTENYVGRAEVGLSADSGLAVRVSSDGQSFTDALRIAPDGSVEMPGGVSGELSLSGRPRGGMNGYDVFYIDPINGDDAGSGRYASGAVRTIAGLEARLIAGRRQVVMVMNDLEFDRMIPLAYSVPKIEFRGLAADGSGYVHRKIIVRDAVNAPGYAGGFQFLCPSVVEFTWIDIELASAAYYPFLFFDTSTGYVRTHTLTLTRTGTGPGTFFGPRRSFIASSHENLVIDETARGYVSEGVAPGVDPNTTWHSPSNVTAF